MRREEVSRAFHIKVSCHQVSTDKKFFSKTQFDHEEPYGSSYDEEIFGEKTYPKTKKE